MDSQIHHNTGISIGTILVSRIIYLCSVWFPSIESLLKWLSVLSVCMVIIINIKPFFKAIRDHKKNILNYFKTKQK